jgi:hypothetical protein
LTTTELHGACSCKWGQKGNFCKHCVAVGLAALTAASVQPPSDDAADLRAALDRLEKTALVDLLMELAGSDPAVLRLLSLRTSPPDFDTAELYSMVDALKRTWHLGDVALARLCREAYAALHALDTFAADHPAASRSLYQRALWHLTACDVGGHPDDGLAAIRDVVTRATNGVIATSLAEPPDPAEFAHWLVDVLMRNSHFPDVSVGRFAEVLGDEGLTSYWQRLSDLDRRARDGESVDRHAIFRLRESYLIDVVKDVDRLVEFYAEDLSRSERYVRIGETLRAAERFEEAIAWLSRGVVEVSWGHTEICDLLVEVYVQTGRPKEAVRARLDDFSREPTEYNYRTLLRTAETIDAASYAHEQAMTVLRERAAGGEPDAADPLVTILIAIDEIDQAWAAAQQFGCSDACMFLLARNRAKRHPADAIPVYAREVDNAIARKDHYGYEKAVELLVSLREIHQRAGSDFDAYLDQVKSTHRRKSALMTYMADANL